MRHSQPPDPVLKLREAAQHFLKVLDECAMLGLPISVPTVAPPRSKQQRTFLRLLVHKKGYGYKEIATIMKVSFHTVRTVARRLSERYEVKGRSGLVLLAQSMGLREG